MRVVPRNRRNGSRSATRARQIARARSVFLALAITFVGTPPASGDPNWSLASGTGLQQAYTLCALGLPLSLNAAVCVEVFQRCGALRKRVRRRVCRPRYDPGAHAMAEAIVEEAIRQASADRGRPRRGARP